MGRVFWGEARSDLGCRRRRSRLGRLLLRTLMTGRAGRLLLTMMVDLALQIVILIEILIV